MQRNSFLLFQFRKPGPPGGVRVSGLCFDDFRDLHVIRHTVAVAMLVSVFVKRFSVNPPKYGGG